MNDNINNEIVYSESKLDVTGQPLILETSSYLDLKQRSNFGGALLSQIKKDLRDQHRNEAKNQSSSRH